MILVIDIGNTNTTFGIFEENSDEIVNYANIKTDKIITTDELAIKYLNIIKNLWKISDNIKINYIIISSVVPEIDYVYYHMFEKYFSISPYFVKNSDFPIRIKYENPLEVGSDRLVNSYAGVNLFPNNNLIIVDFGTATTFDIITKNNEYEGGIIIAGILSSLYALEIKTSKLPHISLAIPPTLIGKNTVDSIRSGAINGTGAMIDELINRIVNELNWSEYKVIATGGLSYLIKHSSHRIDVIYHNLTLIGLYYIWKLKYG